MHPNPVLPTNVNTAKNIRPLRATASFGCACCHWRRWAIDQPYPVFCLTKGGIKVIFGIWSDQSDCAGAKRRVAGEKLAISGATAMSAPDGTTSTIQVPTWNYVAVHLTARGNCVRKNELLGPA